MADRRLPLSVALAATLLTTAVAVPAGTAAAAEAPVYRLPAPAGTRLVVSGGNGERRYRSGDERFAFDFVAPEGEPQRFTVAASRGGTVIGLRSGVRGGRCSRAADGPRPDCWRQVNYVLIDHGDGSSGLYLNLRPGDPVVRRGQVVAAGQPLGRAGSSGWTNEVGVQFQLQRSPSWNEQGRGGWFLTASMPVSFVDASVLGLRPDGVPLTGDEVVSENDAPIRTPFRLQPRPAGLPAIVPLEIDRPRDVASAFEADSPDGYGITFAAAVDRPDSTATTAAEEVDAAAPEGPAGEPDDDQEASDPASTEPPLTHPGTIVRPIFGGELVHAGCASGASASLGRVVLIRRVVGEAEYLAVLGHLSDIEATLLDQDPALPLTIGPNELLGHYGVIPAPGELPELSCPDAGPEPHDLFAAILRDALVSPEGEIIGGVPVSPEPFVGGTAYEGFDWWMGPVTGIAISEASGRPRSRWTGQATPRSSHVPFGQDVDLVTRVRGADVSEVRFRAWYPRWPRVGSSDGLPGFDPRTTWSIVAVCRPPGSPSELARTRGCQWDGDAQDAIVRYAWDPRQLEPSPAAPWLPQARVARRDTEECVPVSLAVEVVDGTGRVNSRIGDLPLPTRCDQPAIDRREAGRVVYLDPLVPPTAPLPRGTAEFRLQPPVGQPEFGGDVVWRDRADNEEGYRVYARRFWLAPDCTIVRGRQALIDTLPANARRYTPRHQRILRLVPAGRIQGQPPGYMNRYQIFVSAFNEAGESRRVFMDGFDVGGEAFCDPGLPEPPPDL